jgi:hypothetical protein
MNQPARRFQLHYQDMEWSKSICFAKSFAKPLTCCRYTLRQLHQHQQVFTAVGWGVLTSHAQEVVGSCNTLLVFDFKPAQQWSVCCDRSPTSSEGCELHSSFCS